MRVREVVLPDGRVHKASDPFNQNPAFQALLISSVLCSNASLNNDGQSSGDPTEVALLVLADEQNFNRYQINQQHSRVAEWSFDSVRKQMSVAVHHKNTVTIHVKGAPEMLLNRCLLDPPQKQLIEDQIITLSRMGRRLLAVAQQTLPIQENTLKILNELDSSEVEKT